jgi:hypothetical protein
MDPARIRAALSIQSTDIDARAAFGQKRGGAVRLITSPGVPGTKRATGAVQLIPRKPQ